MRGVSPSNIFIFADICFMLKELLIPKDVVMLKKIEHALSHGEHSVLAILSTDSPHLHVELKKYFFNTVGVSNIYVDNQTHFLHDMKDTSNIQFIDISQHEKSLIPFQMVQDNLHKIVSQGHKVILFMSNPELEQLRTYYHKLYNEATFIYPFTSIKKEDFLHEKKDILLSMEEIDDTSRYDFFFETAKEMISLELHTQAISFWEKAEKTAYLLNDENKIAIVNYHLGMCNNALNDIDKAIENLKKAQTLYHETYNVQGEIKAYEQLGKSYFQRKEHDKAYEALQNASSLYLGLGYREPKADISLLCAKIDLISGAYDKALQTYITMTAQFEKNSQEMAQVYRGLGEIYRIKKEYDRALKNYFKTTHIYQKLGREEDAALSMIQTAYIYTELGQYQKAQACKAEAVDTLIGIGEQEKAERFLQNMEKYVSKQQKIRMYIH